MISKQNVSYFPTILNQVTSLHWTFPHFKISQDSKHCLLRVSLILLLSIRLLMRHVFQKQMIESALRAIWFVHSHKLHKQGFR